MDALYTSSGLNRTPLGFIVFGICHTLRVHLEWETYNSRVHVLR
jgi:hypothetical protein